MSQLRNRSVRALLIVGFFLAVATATALMYLSRAAAPIERNWPTGFNLASSDNGVLFQVAQDVFQGFPLDWSFSPQVYVFPEVPISLLAYALTAGVLEWYYLVVAVLNVVALAATLWWLSARIFGGSLGRQLLRAAVATAPLVILPLVAQQSLYLFHLAPTYYYGMYLFALLLPVALLTRRKSVRILVLAGWALAGAADPLLLAMTLPSIALALFVLFLRRGRRGSFSRIAGVVAGTVVVAFVVRTLWFNAIAGTSPTNYISVGRSMGRVRGIYSTFKLGFNERFDGWLLALTITALVACAFILVLVLRRYIGAPPHDRAHDAVVLTRVYLCSLPFLGALAMYIILAVHVYYLWFGVVGSIVIAALLVPPPRSLPWLAGAAVLLILGCSALGLSEGRFDDARYFGHRTDLTRCLDASVPGEIGYSTFSDARSNALPSATGVRLIAVNPDLSPNFWLTNRAYSKRLLGTFILVNPKTAEPPLEPDTIRAAWGEPDRVQSCADSELWSYESAAAQQRLAAWFAGYQSLR